MSARRRADIVLVERGLFESRARAQAAIAAGLVRADGIAVARASQAIAADAKLDAQPAHPWVSRGALKLAHALDAFALSAAGRVCMDVGASTGGFSELLLTRGAARVYAVDVGRNQLHASLRERPEIVVFEQTDIRALTRARLPAPPDLVTIDVSFISLRLVLPAALALAAEKANLIALVKPQFEAPRRHNKKGIVRDPAVRDAVCGDVQACVEQLGWRVEGIVASPIAGQDGNIEFLLAATRG